MVEELRITEVKDYNGNKNKYFKSFNLYLPNTSLSAISKITKLFNPTLLYSEVPCMSNQQQKTLTL